MTKNEITDAQIRDAAYLIWLDEGQPHGHDKEHWERAIELLTAAAPKVKKTRKAPAKPRTAKATAAPKAEAKPKASAKKPAATKPTKAKK